MTRAEHAAILQGWYRGEDGAKYCSWSCVKLAPKPKGRGRRIFLKVKAPEGATVGDLDRWRERLTKEFAELAVNVLLREQEHAPEHQATLRQQGTTREFAITDYDSVFKLWKASEGIVLRDVDERPAIRRYLRRNPGMSFVHEVGGEVVGAVLCGTDGRRGYLHHLAVAPEERRRGVGRMLVERALQSLSNAGIDRCHLMVLPSNTAARAFWKSVGWVERSDLLLMSRRPGTP